MIIKNTSIGLYCHGEGTQVQTYDPTNNFQYRSYVKINHMSGGICFMEESSKMGFRLTPITNEMAELMETNLQKELQQKGFQIIVPIKL